MAAHSESPAAPEPVPRGLPAKRAAILRAATAVFLREGYTRTSVDAIAVEAGVSKQTIYNHFDGKEKLFLAVVEQARVATDHGLTPGRGLLEDPAAVEADLVTVSVRYMRALLGSDVSALRRLIIAEVAHHPQLRAAFHDTTSRAVRDWLVQRLADLDRRGVLEVGSADLAAGSLLGLLSYESQIRSAYGTVPVPDAELRRLAGDVVEFFLRACRVRSVAP